MMQAIKDRKKEREQQLEVLSSAIEVLGVQGRTYAYLAGRIREIEGEILCLSALAVLE